jgi:hypothetical protein
MLRAAGHAPRRLDDVVAGERIHEAVVVGAVRAPRHVARAVAGRAQRGEAEVELEDVRTRRQRRRAAQGGAVAAAARAQLRRGRDETRGAGGQQPRLHARQGGAARRRDE